MSDRTSGVAFVLEGVMGLVIFGICTVAFAAQGGTAWMMVPVCVFGVFVMLCVISAGRADLRAWRTSQRGSVDT